MNVVRFRKSIGLIRKTFHSWEGNPGVYMTDTEARLESGFITHLDLSHYDIIAIENMDGAITEDHCKVVRK